MALSMEKSRNIQRSTSNAESSVQRLALDIECSALGVRRFFIAIAFALPRSAFSRQLAPRFLAATLSSLCPFARAMSHQLRGLYRQRSFAIPPRSLPAGDIDSAPLSPLFLFPPTRRGCLFQNFRSNPVAVSLVCELPRSP